MEKMSEKVGIEEKQSIYIGLRAELNGAIVEGGIYFGNQRAYAFRRKIVHMVGVVDRKCL